MKDTSKVIIGATLVMVVTLAFVIALILVLLAELYCSLLLHRHKLKNKNTHQTLTNTKTTLTSVSSPSQSHSHSPQNSPPQPPQNFANFYSQGVLQPPRNFLFPCMENISKEQQIKLHHVINIQTHDESLVSSPTLSMSPFLSRAPPQQKNTTTHQSSNVGEVSSCLEEKKDFVYISNPIYENEEGKESGVKENTPFETPNTSPSHLEKSDSSSSCDNDDGDIVAAEVDAHTPPLTPMKKLDAEACSVSLRDVRSLGTNGSDSMISHSVNGLSSSSSDSPSTSPSW
ncbi:uncharacterized protein LOC131598702 [Vicia villosa]|uniref:uncharacterized protein LOC131598702 n=1 Tax=Vicia villosa TaxID=3911 RepID=UPI00273CC6D4|nr:uncharacterized protein LOC131598702 [Vicia villosa]